MNADEFDYTGYIESINIKGAGPNSHQFLFSLINPKGDKHWTFLLDQVSEPLRYTAMASLVIGGPCRQQDCSFKRGPA